MCSACESRDNDAFDAAKYAMGGMTGGMTEEQAEGLAQFEKMMHGIALSVITRGKPYVIVTVESFEDHGDTGSVMPMVQCSGGSESAKILLKLGLQAIDEGVLIDGN